MWNAIKFLRDYAIQHWTEGNNVTPGWVNINCPLCPSGDPSNHGGFDPQQGKYNCWRCGSHQIQFVVKKLLNVDRKTASDVYWEYSGEHNILQSINRKKLTPKATQITLPGGPLTKFHKKYLKGRGFDPDYLEEKYQLTGTGPGELWKGKNFEFTEKEFNENKVGMKYRISRELFTLRWNDIESMKHSAKYDKEINKALTLFSEAKMMLKNSRKKKGK